MTSINTTLISVQLKTYDELKKLKVTLGLKTFNAVIGYLIHENTPAMSLQPDKAPESSSTDDERILPPPV